MRSAASLSVVLGALVATTYAQSDSWWKPAAGTSWAIDLTDTITAPYQKAAIAYGQCLARRVLSPSHSYIFIRRGSVCQQWFGLGWTQSRRFQDHMLLFGRQFWYGSLHGYVDRWC